VSISYQRIRVFSRWLKANPIVTLLGILATMFGVVKGAPPAWSAVTEILGIPHCLTYSSVYHHSAGRFEKSSGDTWIEQGQKDDVYNFTETHRDRNYIILRNTTPRVGRNATMILRIPVCGGPMQWTYQNPQQWVDLYEVWR
jgi:hypothetical protein